MSQDKRHLKLLADEPGRVEETHATAAGCEDVSEDMSDAPGLQADACGFLQVGDLAKVTGKTVRAIHLYESLGLIEPAKRSKGGYRLFSSDTKSRVRWISKLQSLGLSLSEIQGIAERRKSSGSARSASSDLLVVYAAKLSEVRERLAEYKALEQELVASVDFLKACEHACVGEPHVSGCAQCERRQEEPGRVPDLVSGAQA
jgi:MerR family transcriptional regulator, copper efflux regulator